MLLNSDKENNALLPSLAIYLSHLPMPNTPLAHCHWLTTLYHLVILSYFSVFLIKLKKWSDLIIPNLSFTILPTSSSVHHCLQVCIGLSLYTTPLLSNWSSGLLCPIGLELGYDFDTASALDWCFHCVCCSWPLFNVWVQSLSCLLFWGSTSPLTFNIWAQLSILLSTCTCVPWKYGGLIPKWQTLTKRGWEWMDKFFFSFSSF